MFKCSVIDTSEFKNIFEGLARIIDETQLQADSEGLRCEALSRDHVSFINLDFEKDSFMEFVCDEPMKLNISTDEFYKVLKRAKSNDEIYLEADENNIILTFKGSATRRFTIRQIDLEYSNPGMPELPFTIKEIHTNFNIFKQGVDDCEMYSDKFTLMFDENNISIETMEVVGEIKEQWAHDKMNVLPTKSTYSCEKIKDFLKINKVTEELILSLGEDMPLLCKLIGSYVEIQFMLAPRIEAD